MNDNKPKSFSEAVENLNRACAEFVKAFRTAIMNLPAIIKYYQEQGLIDDKGKPTEKLKQLQKEAKNHEKN